MTAYFSSSLSARSFKLFLLPASAVLGTAFSMFCMFTLQAASIVYLDAIFLEDAQSCNLFADRLARADEVIE